MILFVSVVVAAAVAAAVLIRTAGSLGRSAEDVGEDATREVSGNIYIRDIIGNVSTHDGEDVVTEVRWYISAAPGSDALNLDAMTIRWTHEENNTDLERGDGTCDAGLRDGFCLTSVHDAGDGDVAILDQGDRVRVDVHLDADAGEELGNRETVDALFLHQAGTPTEAGFDTPATFGNQSNVNLLAGS